MSTIEVKVPDIGDFKDVPVIEVLVKPGDTVKAEDSLVTLEIGQGDDGRAVAGGRHGEGVKVKVGDKVTEGSLILTLETSGRRRRREARRCRAAKPAPRSARRRRAPTARPAPPPAARKWERQRRSRG